MKLKNGKPGARLGDLLWKIANNFLKKRIFGSKGVALDERLGRNGESAYGR